ncbi:hypothetical protein E6C27_scaffold75G00310 [Cucumis melo var. makuwa]|uniref:Uncharacterized protein n=1 Tax=Cucumis melo var. makuwa TaxID=1194695 RepID=A0A5A7TP12_CUCMM|nr:hypothetical protein E6C27_scaffold75G00310 [Cucumis melo var. makuwa]
MDLTMLGVITIWKTSHVYKVIEPTNEKLAHLNRDLDIPSTEGYKDNPATRSFFEMMVLPYPSPCPTSTSIFCPFFVSHNPHTSRDTNGGNNFEEGGDEYRAIHMDLNVDVDGSHQVGKDLVAPMVDPSVDLIEDVVVQSIVHMDCSPIEDVVPVLLI